MVAADDEWLAHPMVGGRWFTANGLSTTICRARVTRQAARSGVQVDVSATPCGAVWPSVQSQPGLHRYAAGRFGVPPPL